MKEVGEVLWAKIKENKTLAAPRAPDSSSVFEHCSRKKPDMRFINLNWLDSDEVAASIQDGPNPDVQFEYFFAQYASQHVYRSLDPELVKLLPTILQKKDYKLLNAVFKNCKKLPRARNEPLHLFFLN